MYTSPLLQLAGNMNRNMGLELCKVIDENLEQSLPPLHAAVPNVLTAIVSR